MATSPAGETVPDPLRPFFAPGARSVWSGQHREKALLLAGNRHDIVPIKDELWTASTSFPSALTFRGRRAVG